MTNPAQQDPMVPLIKKWEAVRTEQRVLGRIYPDWDVPAMEEIEVREEELFEQIVRTKPTTPIGRAYQLRALWTDFGPGDSGLMARLMLAALNAAEMAAGLPLTERERPRRAA